MADAFETLGLPYDADTKQIRAAYRRSVKVCHPDNFTDATRQSEAQEQLIRLNLAYAEALKSVSRKKSDGYFLPQEDAIKLAEKYLRQSNPESAFRQLNRADTKDAGFFYLQGEILMKMRQYDTAQRSYREAVRRDPDNETYRKAAFSADLLSRRSRHPLLRLVRYVKRLIGIWDNQTER